MEQFFTVLIVMLGLIFLQYQYFRFERETRDEGQKSTDFHQVELLQSDIHQLREEFAEYKKRVDVLHLKAGFKL